MHSDLVVNDWHSETQRRVAVAHPVGHDVKLEVLDPTYEVPLPLVVAAPAHGRRAGRRDDPDGYVELLQWHYHGSSFFATPAHEEDDCPFGRDNVLPMADQAIDLTSTN